MWHLVASCCPETMFTRRLKKLPTVDRRYQRDLAWGLQPILLWLQMLAIPSVQLRSSSPFQRVAVPLVGMVMVIWMVSSNVLKLLNYIHTGINDSKQSLTWIWIDALQELQHHSISILTSISLFIGAYVQQKSMWSSFVLVERSLRFDENFYRSVRRTSMAAIAVLIFVSEPYIRPDPNSSI